MKILLVMLLIVLQKNKATVNLVPTQVTVIKMEHLFIQALSQLG